MARANKSGGTSPGSGTSPGAGGGKTVKSNCPGTYSNLGECPSKLFCTDNSLWTQVTTEQSFTNVIPSMLASWQTNYALAFDPTLIVECDQYWNFLNLLDFAYRCIYAPDDFMGIYSHPSF